MGLDVGFPFRFGLVKCILGFVTTRMDSFWSELELGKPHQNARVLPLLSHCSQQNSLFLILFLYHFLPASYRNSNQQSTTTAFCSFKFHKCTQRRWVGQLF